MALMQKLREAYKNTAAKMLLNFGKVFPPLASSWAQVMQHIQVDKNCDQECAVECLDYRAGCESMFFNPTCLDKCKCKFAISSVDPEHIKTKMDEVTKNAENVNHFFKGIGAEDMKIIKPSYDSYLIKARDLHEEFGELVLEHAGNVFGCDNECLSDCVERPDMVSFWEVPLCLKKCKCGSKQGLIRIDRDELPLEKEILHHEVEEEEEDRNLGIMDRLRMKHLTSLFGITKDSDEEEEDFLESRKVPFGTHRHHDVSCDKVHHDFDIPELMKYSDYDKKAWNFFKRYQEDI